MRLAFKQKGLYDDAVCKIGHSLVQTLLHAPTVNSFLQLWEQSNAFCHSWYEKVLSAINHFTAISGALLTGNYGLWNTYVLLMMVLYAPSNTGGLRCSFSPV